MFEDELKRTIEFGLHGAPELKLQEKKIFLGEFRERVIMALTREDAQRALAMDKAKEAIKDSDAEIIIINNRVPIDIMSKYMKLAKTFNKEYKTVDSTSPEAMGLVIASRRAINRENVIAQVERLPEKFQKVYRKDLCPECYEELRDISPDYAKEFKRITAIDKLVGIRCGACEREVDSGPLM